MSRVIRGDKRVLAGEVVDAKADADRIRAEANEEAKAIRKAAEDDAARVRALASAEGDAAARAEAAAVIARAQARRDALLLEAESALAQLGAEAARRIVNAELTLAPERIRDVVRGVLDKAKRAREVIVRVHPDDAPLVASLESVRIEEDASLARGDCVLHTELGELDARIEVQIAALDRALRDS